MSSRNHRYIYLPSRLRVSLLQEKCTILATVVQVIAKWQANALISRQAGASCFRNALPCRGHKELPDWLRRAPDLVNLTTLLCLADNEMCDIGSEVISR